MCVGGMLKDSKGKTERDRDRDRKRECVLACSKIVWKRDRERKRVRETEGCIKIEERGREFRLV